MGAKVQVYTDSRNLTFWNKAKLGAIEQRWVAEMSVFDYIIHHKPGKANALADHLSRYPMEEPAQCDVEEGDVPICAIEATAILPELGLIDSRALQAKVGATEALSEVEGEYSEIDPLLTLPSYSPDELREFQQKDDSIATVARYIIEHVRLSKMEMRVFPIPIKSSEATKEVEND